MKKESKSRNITVSLPEFHHRKLTIMADRLGLTKSGIIQRLIEQHTNFRLGDSEEKRES